MNLLNYVRQYNLQHKVVVDHDNYGTFITIPNREVCSVKRQRFMKALEQSGRYDLTKRSRGNATILEVR